MPFCPGFISRGRFLALSFFLILLPGLPVKNSLPVEQTHSANIISFSIYENENEPRLDDFLPLFVCFGTKIFSQHQTSTTLLGLVRENRATPVLTRSLVRSPTSTPKPRAEGSSPSAPAKKERQASACLSFFVVTGVEASARGACRASPPKRRLWRMQRGGDGAAVGDWQGGPAAADRAGHRKRACEASSSPSLHFHHAIEEPPSLSLLYSVLSHPASSVSNRCYPLQHPERTRFRPFGAFPGAFRCFCPLLTRKILGLFFVHLAA